MSKRIVRSISVISSAVCNLDCSFCYLNKNSAYKKFNEIVHETWEKKEYVHNMVKSLIKLNVDLEEVTTLQLWGGETLLNIDDISMNLEEFYEVFPNVSEWKISTNWMIDVNKFFNFIKKINDLASKKTSIFLQLSIDGPPGPILKDGHAGDWQTYRKNIEKFTNLVNNTLLKNIEVIFAINATVKKELYLQEFSTYEGIKNYVSYMLDFCHFIEEHCISKSLTLGTLVVLPGFAMPSDTTVEEGLELAKICRLWDYVKQNEFPHLPEFFDFSKGIGVLNREVSLLQPNVECGELNGSLTFLPDGSICECSGVFMASNPDYIQELERKGEIKDLQTAKVAAARTFNPLTATEEELEIYDWSVFKGYKNNNSTYLTYMLATCEELALSGQIPYRYAYDKEWAMEQIKALSSTTTCSRENVADTAISFIINPSIYRRYCNGLLEYVYDNHKYRLELEEFNNGNRI